MMRKKPRTLLPLVVASVLLLCDCATRQVNPPIVKYDPGSMREVQQQWHRGNQQDLVILAFSGGGTRAASFSYGVLETLRNMEVVTRIGEKKRLLDEVDLITGVSGGSFTALAYGLYGEQLFGQYESRFLKRDVQGELVGRILNPVNWPAESSTGWGRSELAANLYDEILFNGATFADLYRAGGPMIAVSATELGTGSRIVFIPQNFDVMCADLHPIRISRAAAASSAVPVVLSPITINNYGGSCGYQRPEWLEAFAELSDPPRPAARALNRLAELEELDNGVEDPYFHLVDGGISDNLGLRSVLDILETYEALHDAGRPTPLDNVRSIIIFVVNSVPAPSTKWNESENPPGTAAVMMRSAGLPIARYSREMVEQLRDIDARWTALRQIRDSVNLSKDKNPALAEIVNVPNADIYVVDVSFKALQDKSEMKYLNQLPTSFVLPDEAVDRLRTAARTLILNSPDLQQALKASGERIVEQAESNKLPAVLPPARPTGPSELQ
ncbi:MAG TPA: patatin-like phospholipase family protein [Candidatus Binataceae bacterium]|nr:patatin-like phospholipase family protein [Candidatus Binataceae bacterium]